MTPYSTLSLKIMMLILAFTALVALHINPTATSITSRPATDTTHAEALPPGLLPWALSLLEDETYTRLKNTPMLRYQRPDQIITQIVDGSKRKRDTVGIDLGRFDSQH
jgi:hypothetical protein